MIEITHDGPETAQPVELQGSSQLPDALPVLPLREMVAFPNTMMPLAIGQERSVKLVNDVLAADRLLVMVASKDPSIEAPGPDEIYRVGVVGVVARMLKMPDGTIRILVNGGQRVRIENFVSTEPYLVGRIREEPDVIVPSSELEALVRHVQNTFSAIIEGVPYLPEELQIAVANVDDPSMLASMIASSLRIKPEEKQELLEERNVTKRLRRLSELLAREMEVMELGSKIQSQVQSEMDKAQREYFLRQQMKAIQEELGEVDEQQAEVNELREQMEEANLPDFVREAAERELSRLERLPQAAAEHGVIRTYLEWILSLPWSKPTEDNLDLRHARKVLDEDHYDIEKVKDRILEHLAVRKLKPDARGSILSFVGPPGVGKTSLGKSIARALERKFERISVGGVRDEAEIRGHRRTYIGAMPGTIIRALRDAESNNPVFMIDEIDKMGADFRGDPASAMLEVLDPEQNQNFRDHYLDLPFDLSHVFFITTANVLEAIPGPLRDRMEVIQLAGYTAEEKHQIARRYLIPRQIERNGLTPSQIEIKDEVIDVIIEEYTREAGVRNLEREIGSLCRKVAREFAEGNAKRKVTVTAAKARQMLGKRRFFSEARRRTSEPGVATGLAWTPVGGEVLFIEATDFPGTGKLNITGQLGDVMRESAQAALSFVRAHAKELSPELPDDYFGTHDIHIHVPAGATPKDGPSAGVAITAALASLISGRPVRDDTAMTGELTLTGQVLPIGGLKEKALAAQAAEIKRVVAPRLNQQDIDEIPEHLRKDLEFIFVERIEDALKEVLVEDGASADGRRPSRARSRRGSASRNGTRRKEPARAARARKVGVQAAPGRKARTRSRDR
jgi:ATP-dependent Lon protease